MSTHKDVIQTFSSLTGIEFRHHPHYVERQACQFLDHFTLEELELVILWVKWRIANRASGFTASSYSWRRLFGDHGAGDEWQTFQERLGLAREAIQRGAWKPTKFTPKPVAPSEPEGFRPWLAVHYPDADQSIRWRDVPESVRREYGNANRRRS